MREDVFTDHQARFAIGTRHARMESDAAALSGVVKALLVLLLEMLTPDWGAGKGQKRHLMALAVCFWRWCCQNRGKTTASR